MAVSPTLVQQNDSCLTLGGNYIILGHSYSWAYVCHSSTWKRYLQIEIIASSSNCRPCCFQSVWNMKNVCFLVCIFSTNLQRLSLLKNHGSDLKTIIFKTGKKRKDHIGFHLPWLYYIFKGKIPICKNFKPIIRCMCIHPHLQIYASLPLS